MKNNGHSYSASLFRFYTIAFRVCVNFSLWSSCFLNDKITDSLKIPTCFTSKILIYPFKTGVYFLFYHLYILHGDLYGSQLSLLSYSSW